MLPADVTLLSVYPHAHYLGKEMRVERRCPTAPRSRCCTSRAGDFHWQQDYRYVDAVRAAARHAHRRCATPTTTRRRTTTIRSHPPRRVTWGPQSSDEMGNLGLQLLASPADRALLVRTFAEREARDNVRGAEMRVKHAPDDPAERTWLGSSYLEVGRVAEAIAQLEMAVRQRPDAVQARNFLGGALLAAGRTEDAIAQLQAAVTLAPRDAHLQFNLGKALATARTTRQPPPIGSRGRSRSIRASRSRTRSSACSCSRTGESARRFRICSVRSNLRRTQRRRTAISVVRLPRPGALPMPLCTCAARWSWILRTRSRAREPRAAVEGD